MRRREFLKKGSAAAFSVMLTPQLIKTVRTPPASEICKVHADGSFDLLFETINITGCFPAIDDIALKPIKISKQVDGNNTRIFYQLIKGTFLLDITIEHGLPVLKGSLSGWESAPATISYMAHAKIIGADHFFKQGLGFGGQSGIFPLKKSVFQHDQNNLIEQSWLYESYMVTALIAYDREVVVFGAMDHKDYQQRTSIYNIAHRQGLVDAKPPVEDIFLLNIAFLTEKIPLRDKQISLPKVYFTSGTNPHDELSNFAKRIAHHNNLKLKEKAIVYWDSWYEYYEEFDSYKFDEFLTGLETVKPKVPLDVIYISAGYCALGDWLDADQRIFIKGLKHEVEKIKSRGYKVGLYAGPFMVSDKSKLYQQHPDWVLKDLQGKPIIDSEGKKGMIDNLVVNEKRMYLDSSHPEAFQYLKHIFETYREWGTSVYFIDFLDWGLKNSQAVKRFTPGKTSVQYFYDVMKMIRETVGDDAYIIGCIAPFAPIIGLTDVVRVAYDTVQSWSDNIVNMLRESEVSSYFNQVLWYIDPDVLTLRHSSQVSLSDDEVQTLAYWSGMLGGIISTSDRFHRLQPDRLKLWRFVAATGKNIKSVFPYWLDEQKKFKYLLRSFNQDNHVLLVANISDTRISEKVSIKEILGDRIWHAFNWQPGKFTPIDDNDELFVSLEAHQSILFYLTIENIAPDARLSLGGELIEGLI